MFVCRVNVEVAHGIEPVLSQLPAIYKLRKVPVVPENVVHLRRKQKQKATTRKRV